MFNSDFFSSDIHSRSLLTVCDPALYRASSAFIRFGINRLIR